MSPSPSLNGGGADTNYLTKQRWGAGRGPGCGDGRLLGRVVRPRAIAPVLEELAEASEGRVTLMQVNVNENPGLAAGFGIRSIPTIVFFKRGGIVDRVIGAPKAVLQDEATRNGGS